MKKITLIICLVGASLIGYSQQGARDPKMDHPEYKRMELTRAKSPLSAEQMEKWGQVMRKYNAQIQELKKNNQQADLTQIHQLMVAELDAIFTPEQRKILAELRGKPNTQE